MAYLLKSFRSNNPDQPRRIYFWQTPWVVNTLHGDREVGGWVMSSSQATIYPTREEAESVAAMRGLWHTTPVEAAKFLTPQE